MAPTHDADIAALRAKEQALLVELEEVRTALINLGASPYIAGKDKCWAELSVSEREAACSLGYHEQTWEEGEAPSVCAKQWTTLDKRDADAAKRLGLKHKKMVSRAYHDSLFVAEIAPTAMLFIPCFKGYSHRPDEYASPEDIKNGVEALAYALAQLSLH